VRLSAVRRIAMDAKIQQPQLYVSYPTPPNFAAGDHELDPAGHRAGGRKGVAPVQRLVYEMKIAQSVTAGQQSQLLASSFEITASPMPGHTLDEILAVIDEEIAAVQAKPLEAAELDRAKNQLESDTVRSLESLLARAERLQSYNYLVGDPGFLTEDLRRYRAVDAGAHPARRAAVPEEGRSRDRHHRPQPRRADHGTDQEMTPRADSARRVWRWRLRSRCASAPPPPADRARPPQDRAPPPAAAPPARRRPAAAAPRRPRDAGRAVPPARARRRPGADVQAAEAEALQAEERPRGDAGRVPRPAARSTST
jgi:hypothetical protein